MKRRGSHCPLGTPHTYIFFLFILECSSYTRKIMNKKKNSRFLGNLRPYISESNKTGKSIKQAKGPSVYP